jgi:O-antigen ligase
MDRFRLPQSVARRTAPAVAVVAVVVGVALGGGRLADYWDEFQHQRTVTTSEDPASRLASGGGTRSDVWDSALDAFSSEPLGGIGPGTFEFHWSENAGTGQFLRDAHSLYIEELAELGLPGLLLLIGFVGGGAALAVWARVGMRRTSEIAAAAAMASGGIVFVFVAGVDWMWELTAVAVLGLAAIGVGMAARVERDPQRRMAPRARIATTVGALTIALNAGRRRRSGRWARGRGTSAGQRGDRRPALGGDTVRGPCGG